MTRVIGKLKIDADISLEAFRSEVREVDRPRTRGDGVMDPSLMSVVIPAAEWSEVEEQLHPIGRFR
jgi:hypothetical protein